MKRRGGGLAGGGMGSLNVLPADTEIWAVIEKRGSRQQLCNSLNNMHVNSYDPLLESNLAASFSNEMKWRRAWIATRQDGFTPEKKGEGGSLLLSEQNMPEQIVWSSLSWSQHKV